MTLLMMVAALKLITGKISRIGLTSILFSTKLLSTETHKHLPVLLKLRIKEHLKPQASLSMVDFDDEDEDDELFLWYG